MKGVPPEQVEMIMQLIDQKPDLFKKIAEEIDARMKKGEHQMFATMEVMKKYAGELREVMGSNPALMQQLTKR
jgi:hypothetical protein